MNTTETRSARGRLLVGLGAAAATVAAGWTALRQPAVGRPAPRGAPRAHGSLPNPIVHTHDGRSVRFYDDLIRDKVVAIHMTYLQCSETCPPTIGNLIRVQELLGERAGRDVFIYSITLVPELDTPAAMKDYVAKLGLGKGWTFLTGAPEDIESIRRGLGFFDVDPAVDADRNQHAGMIRIGNGAVDRWTMAPGLVRPEQILSTINHVDRSVVHTAGHRAAA